MANLTRWLYLLFFVNVVNFSVCLEKLEPLQCSAISAETLFLNTDDSYGYLTRNGSQTKNFSCSQLKKSSAKQTNLLNNRIISSHLFSHLPPIAPVQSPNPVCARQSQTYLDRLRNLDLWAVQMYDGSAKIPSGLLNGNVNQFGDFDLCMGAKQPDGEGIQGQYCLSYVELEVANSENKNLQHILNLMKSFSPFKSKLEDPGHRVPRFSSINWAVCVPSSCSPQDVETSMESTLHKYLANTGLKYRVRVDPEMCQIREDFTPTIGTILAGAFFILILTIIGVTTALEYFEVAPQNSGLVTQCLMGFSLIKNTKKLISLDRSPDDIECVHGIRTLNAFMLLLSHKSMALFFNPYINRTQMASNLGKPWTVVARAASLYTDPFIMLSGLLTSYAFLRQFEKNKKINVMKEIVSRCFRLLPTLGALILFCTFILPFLGSGPQWNLVVSHHATICKQYWWRNMMFIHNYFGFKNMLSLFIYFGNPVSKMFDTADYSYILPTHRLTVYAMGIALGYLLRHCGRDFKLKSSHITLGWCIASGFLYQSVFIPAKMGDMNYTYDRLDAANYAAFAPITWCLVFMISYTFYLTQFPLFFYNVGTMRGAQQYSFGLLINLKETLAIILASVILTLAFEMPFQNIRTALLKSSGSKPAVLSKQEQSRLMNNNNNNNADNNNVVDKKAVKSH
ncbi:hypothetical protein M8J75_014303 [Diaphorina citri]|nr:hypothetical protein M8J75_014303 [Diaphorina citri]